MPGYKVTLQQVDDAKQLESEWLALQQQSDCSYFQSWNWIGTWLEQISIGLRPTAVKVWYGDSLVGIGIFVSRFIKRHIFIRSKAMLLNEYPYDGKNMSIEYNGLLAASEHQEAVYAAVVRHVSREYGNCDEIYFGAISDTETETIGRLCDQSLVGFEYIVIQASTCWSIDLLGTPPGIAGFLSTLSKNRRGQIRRSIRLYETNGPLQIEEASNTEEALYFFEKLKQLHGARWQAKGKQGALANPQRVLFHQALILRCFDNGSLQFLKISCAYGEIGYVYSLIWRKHVYVLQTGFRFSEDKRLMPGYVTHALAVAYNKSKGHAIYDLMHGNEPYKQRLCNRNRKLLWVVLQRHKLKFKLEKIAVGTIRQLRKLEQ